MIGSKKIKNTEHEEQKLRIKVGKSKGAKSKKNTSKSTFANESEIVSEENTSANTSENVSENASANISENVSENASANVSENVSENTSANESEESRTHNSIFDSTIEFYDKIFFEGLEKYKEVPVQYSLKNFEEPEERVRPEKTSSLKDNIVLILPACLIQIAVCALLICLVFTDFFHTITQLISQNILAIFLIGLHIFMWTKPYLKIRRNCYQGLYNISKSFSKENKGCNFILLQIIFLGIRILLVCNSIVGNFLSAIFG